MDAVIPAMQNYQQKGAGKGDKPVEFDAVGTFEDGGVMPRPGNARDQQPAQQPRLQPIGMLEVVVDGHARGERQPSAVEEKPGIVAGRGSH